MNERQKKPELLAPAGSWEMLRAAVRCGADAVYLGSGRLNARAGAKNFSPDEFPEIHRYCKTRGVSWYLALNTLMLETELDQAYEVAGAALSAGAGALILQDLGLAAALRRRFSGAVLHASTQCSVQSPGGLQILKELGFARAVVPRECTKEELCALLESGGIELEAFVHGAHCVSLSGQCLLSFCLGGRSGNRGVCAQPCRLPYNGAQPLSLKDLCLLAHVNSYPLNRIASFKIEGRLKRPEYAAAAVSAYRAALDGTESPVSQEDLRLAFSRGGFTDGYYQNARGADMLGTRTKDDIADAAFLKRTAALYEHERACVGCALELREGVLTFSALNTSVRVSLAEGEGSVCAKERITAQLRKLGGTQFYVEAISVDRDYAAPVSAVNALRRAAIALWEDTLCAS